jgi:hypothetical protein
MRLLRTGRESGGFPAIMGNESQAKIDAALKELAEAVAELEKDYTWQDDLPRLPEDPAATTGLFLQNRKPKPEDDPSA